MWEKLDGWYVVFVCDVDVCVFNAIERKLHG